MQWPRLADWHPPSTQARPVQTWGGRSLAINNCPRCSRLRLAPVTACKMGQCPSLRKCAQSPPIPPANQSPAILSRPAYTSNGQSRYRLRGDADSHAPSRSPHPPPAPVRSDAPSPNRLSSPTTTPAPPGSHPPSPPPQKNYAATTQHRATVSPYQPASRGGRSPPSPLSTRATFSEKPDLTPQETLPAVSPRKSPRSARRPPASSPLRSGTPARHPLYAGRQCHRSPQDD